MPQANSSDRAYAKRLLLHYFDLVSSEPLSPDCRTEIGEIVDAIVEAAVEQAKHEIRASVP